MSIMDHKWGKSHYADRFWSAYSGMRPALADRRCILTVQAFFDESYSPDGYFVFGGYLSTAERWAQLTQQWEELLPTHGVLNRKTGRYRFKFKEMNATEERRARIPDFFRIIDDCTIMSVSFIMNIGDFERAKSRLWVPNGRIDFFDLGNPYRFVLFQLMGAIHSDTIRLAVGDDLSAGERIDVIFDDEIRLKRAVIREWERFVESSPESSKNRFGSDPRWEDDDEYLPLQAADLWAGAMRHMLSQGKTKAQDITDLYESLGGADKSKWRSLNIKIDEDGIARTFCDLLRNVLTDNRIIYDVSFGGVRL